MKRSICPLVTGLVLALAPKASAFSVVFSNLQANSIPCSCKPDQGTVVGTFQYAPLVHWVMGNGFTVPSSSDFVFNSLFLPMAVVEGTANSVWVGLFSAALNGLPDHLIEEFTIEGKLPFLDIRNIRFPSVVVDSVTHPILTAGAAYWLLATTPGPDSGVSWFANNIGDLGPTAARFNDYPFDTFRDDLRSAFAVYGDPVIPVPEPSSGQQAVRGLALILTALLWARARKG